jgi:dGTPase
MRDHGGFEGNAQTLRLLARRELYSDDYGLDLTRRALLGVLKYPASYSRVRQRKWPDPPSSPSELKRDNWTSPKCMVIDFLSGERGCEGGADL